MRALPVLAAFALALAAAGAVSCASGGPHGATAAGAGGGPERRAKLDLVMKSSFCATCHPAIYAEHMQNTHGLAFVDEEARLATREFRRENCIRCHTPRPVAETGIGMVPIERHHDLEEGNTCMTCHMKAGYDYAAFRGGAECKSAFDGRVGEVQACATCHRIAGTPEQWETAAHGNVAGRKCIDCHMPFVERPVAVGQPPRRVRSHSFPASQNEAQIRKAYAYDAQIEGNELVVRVRNEGAGHNFPTAAQQRSLESLVVIRDAEGKEVTRTRAVFKHPYADTTSLDLPVSTQIPSGQTREQRVPIHVDAGTIECELFFKLYYPIEDGHPQLSRRLERRTMTFRDIAPSVKPVDVPTRVPNKIAEVSPEEAARPDRLAKFAHPAPGTRAVRVPQGDSGADVAALVALLEFPVPKARVLARERLLELGERAVPALIAALGHWSDETFDQAMELLTEMGDRAAPAVRAAFASDRLYVRIHARMTAARMGFPGDRAAWRDDLVRALSAAHPLDRRSAADALGPLGDAAAAPALRELLADEDWDVVAAAAHSLALLSDRDSAPAVADALRLATFVESRRDLAAALAGLGDPSGVPVLLDGLDHPDDVIRRTFFDAFFAVTGLHLSYDPDAPRRDRLDALAALRSFWEQKGGAALLRPLAPSGTRAELRAFALVEELGGGTDVKVGGDDAVLLERLVSTRGDAVPALIQGLTFPAGFTRKRALVCEALGKIGDARAAPYLIRALRDPNLSVSAWACWSLESCGDPGAIPALRRYSRRLAAYADAHPGESGTESAVRLEARAARTRARLGDTTASHELEVLGQAADSAAAAIPARVEGTIATIEAPPVPVPTSEEDAITKASSLRGQDYYEDAIRVLDAAEERFGKTAPLRLERAWNLLMIAEEDMTRDLDKARIDAEVADARMGFDEAVRMDAKVTGREVLEAGILRYEGREEDARRVLEAFVAAHPDDARAHQELGHLAYAMKDWAVAEREYAALAKLAPRDGWAVLYATLARQWQGRPAADLDDGYVTAAKLLPEVETPLRLIVKLHAPDPARAMELLQVIVADRPRAVWARIFIAHLQQTGPAHDVAAAEATLREALAIAPKDRAAHFNLGKLLAETGRTAAAVAELTEAAEAAAMGDVAETANALDALLTAPDPRAEIPVDLRLRAWNAIVSRSPADGRFAHDAGRWYADVAHDPKEARTFLEAAAAAEPDNDTYRADAAHAKSDPARPR
jgi:HEAT repeat protein/Tfp pilus assembly protein PilF